MAPAQRDKFISKIGPYLYILPAAIIIFTFRLIPIILSFIISFFEWTITGAGKFIAFDNYTKIFQDTDFWQSILNTFWLVIIIVPVSLVFSLIFASLLNSIKKLRGLFRTTYYIPTITSLVAVSIIWKIIYNQQSGLANYFLGFLNINPFAWLSESRGIFDLMISSVDLQQTAAGLSASMGMAQHLVYAIIGGPSLALFSIILVTIWRGMGYNTIIYLAGLQNVPQVYYEAADIDGASKLRQFFKITVPLISPTSFYVVMMTTITTFQVFSQVYLMTGPPIGGPLGTTKVIVYYIYELGFGETQNLSYASAVALILFIVILSLTLIQRKLEKRVHYN